MAKEDLKRHIKKLKSVLDSADSEERFLQLLEIDVVLTEISGKIRGLRVAVGLVREVAEFLEAEKNLAAVGFRILERRLVVMALQDEADAEMYAKVSCAHLFPETAKKPEELN